LRYGENAQNETGDGERLPDSQGKRERHKEHRQREVNDVEGRQGEEIVPAVEKRFFDEETNHIVSILPS
jgi:hypothetical protein